MTRRPAVMPALLFAAGIGCEGMLGPVPLLFIAAGSLGLAMAAAFLRRIPFGACLLILAFLCGACAAWDHALLPPDDISLRMDALKGRDVSAVCRLVSSVEQRAGGLAPRRVFVCDLERVAGEKCSGRVTVNLFGPVHFMYGDRVALTGKFSRPFELSSAGRLSYRAHLARQGIRAVFHVKKNASRLLLASPGGWAFGRLALEARAHLQGIFFRYLSPGEAGLMNAMLLGPRGDIPKHVYDVFRKSGTAHIIAISGMNMTLTALGVMFLLGLFSMRRVPRAVLAVLILAFYSFMAGHGAPVARAAFMAAVVILSFVVERETDPLNSLALAALVLLAAAPGDSGDIGCQLSFVCVLSLVILTPLILAPFEARGWKERRFLWFFIESAAVTLAAFLGSAGILAYDFGYLTPVGFIVNLPVIPLMALVTALGAGLLGTGLLLPWIAGYFALCLKVVLNVSVGVLTLASQVPVMDCPDIPIGWVFVYYVALGAGTALFYAVKGRTAGPAFIDKPIPL